MAQFGNFSQGETIGLIDAGLAFNLPFPPLNDHEGRRPERKPDVVIFIDASADAENVNILGNRQAWPDGAALTAVKDYARANKVAFPRVPEIGNLAENTCTVFNEVYKQGRQEPVIIYLPLTKNRDELNNGALLERVRNENNFHGVIPGNLAEIALNDYTTSYTNMAPQYSVNLMALMHYNVLYNQRAILNAICARVHTGHPEEPRRNAPAAAIPAEQPEEPAAGGKRPTAEPAEVTPPTRHETAQQFLTRYKAENGALALPAFLSALGDEAIYDYCNQLGLDYSAAASGSAAEPDINKARRVLIEYANNL